MIAAFNSGDDSACTPASPISRAVGGVRRCKRCCRPTLDCREKYTYIPSICSRSTHFLRCSCNNDSLTSTLSTPCNSLPVSPATASSTRRDVEELYHSLNASTVTNTLNGSESWTTPRSETHSICWDNWA